MLRIGLVVLCGSSLSAFAQPPKAAAATTLVRIDQPDAHRTRGEFSQLLDRYPPSVRGVLAMDPNLLTNESFLAPYPALGSFLEGHPEIVRNPSFYVGESPYSKPPGDYSREVWNKVLEGVAVFGGFGMAIGLFVWLTRTLIDYRRWSRLAKVQTDVHTKLLDRFTASDDLLAYIQSPSGARFLEGAPIHLDAAPRSLGAPLGRILWSVQGGVVLLAAGIGLQLVSGQVSEPAGQPLHVLGILGIALGVGFLFSAIISFAISHRLGLIETAAVPRVEAPGA